MSAPSRAQDFWLPQLPYRLPDLDFGDVKVVQNGASTAYRQRTASRKKATQNRYFASAPFQWHGHRKSGRFSWSTYGLPDVPANGIRFVDGDIQALDGKVVLAMPDGTLPMIFMPPALIEAVAGRLLKTANATAAARYRRFEEFARRVVDFFRDRPQPWRKEDHPLGCYLLFSDRTDGKGPLKREEPEEPELAAPKAPAPSRKQAKGRSAPPRRAPPSHRRVASSTSTPRADTPFSDRGVPSETSSCDVQVGHPGEDDAFPSDEVQDAVAGTLPNADLLFDIESDEEEEAEPVFVPSTLEAEPHVPHCPCHALPEPDAESDPSGLRPSAVDLYDISIEYRDGRARIVATNIEIDDVEWLGALTNPPDADVEPPLYRSSVAERRAVRRAKACPYSNHGRRNLRQNADPSFTLPVVPPPIIDGRSRPSDIVYGPYPWDEEVLPVHPLAPEASWDKMQRWLGAYGARYGTAGHGYQVATWNPTPEYVDMELDEATIAWFDEPAMAV